MSEILCLRNNNVLFFYTSTESPHKIGNLIKIQYNSTIKCLIQQVEKSIIFRSHEYKYGNYVLHSYKLQM